MKFLKHEDCRGNINPCTSAIISSKEDFYLYRLEFEREAHQEIKVQSEQRFKMIIAVLLVLFLASSACAIWNYYINHLDKATLAEFEEKISSQEQYYSIKEKALERKIFMLETGNSLLHAKNNKEIAQIQEEYDFYHSSAVIVTSSGNCYHKYNCSYLNNSKEYYIFNSEYAISQGYKQCSRCF